MTANPLFRTMLLAGFVGMAGATGALAQPYGGFGGHHDHGGDMGAILHAANLTSAQQQQVHALMEAERSATDQTRSQLHAVDGEIKAKLLSSGTVTLSDLAPLMAQKQQLMATLEQSRMSTLLQARNLLSAQQLSQAASVETQLEQLHAQEHALMAPPAATAE